MKHKINISIYRKYIHCIVIALVLWTISSYSQAGKPRRLVLHCDLARFRNTAEQGYLEFYFSFSPGHLFFQQRGEKFHGGVNLSVQLKKNPGDELILQKYYFVPVHLDDTSDVTLNQMFVSQRGYELPFGLYHLDVIATDSLDKSRLDSVASDFEISPFGNDPCTSDLELSSSITPSQDTVQSFYKNTLQVVPNPSLVFGGVNYPVLCHYLELYNLQEDSVYNVEISVIDQNGVEKKKANKQKNYKVINAVEVGTMTVTSLPSGRYMYQVRILDGVMSKIAEVRKYFFANNPHIPIAVSPISMKATELLGMSSDELVKEFRQAQYLATDQEKKTFSQITSLEGQREFLAKYWTELEHGRLGRQPVTRNEYLQRVSVAKSRYGNIFREGWQTDRGRVYILYAEPDEVERFPSSENVKPYEVWNYNQIENGVKFIFVDINGFGEYRLVHSTKRGEIQDPSWERNLQ